MPVLFVAVRKGPVMESLVVLGFSEVRPGGANRPKDDESSDGLDMAGRGVGSRVGILPRLQREQESS